VAKSFSDNPIVRLVNTVAVSLMDAPLVGLLVRRGLVTIRYVGRRSGKTYEIPVGYRRSNDSVVIGVSMPDAKQWWRNFLGDGSPITLVGFGGRDRSGRATARRDDRGRVTVTVHLDTP
jgi:hypothetical protein